MEESTSKTPEPQTGCERKNLLVCGAMTRKGRVCGKTPARLAIAVDREDGKRMRFFVCEKHLEQTFKEDTEAARDASGDIRMSVVRQMKFAPADPLAADFYDVTVRLPRPLQDTVFAAVEGFNKKQITGDAFIAAFKAALKEAGLHWPPDREGKPPK